MSFPLKIFSFLAFALFLSACEKPDPTPELKSAEYILYLEDERSAQAITKEAEAGVVSAQNDLKAVAPQTGQNKFAEKRLWEAQARLDKAKQNEQLSKIRLQVRKAQIREEYLKAYYDKTEITKESKEDLLKRRSLASTDRGWSVKKRRAAMGLTTKDNNAGEAATTPEKPEANPGH